MSSRYLGDEFDIHGGGLDLLFPHHECEIAQSVGSNGKEAVKYWLHNNMITLNGQKMAKSLGNTIMLHQFFNGDHPLLQQAYDPMTIRFFILQAHYRSTVDFSNEALQAAEKGLTRLNRMLSSIDRIDTDAWSTADQDETTKLNGFVQQMYAAMDDDLNTALAIGAMFELGSWFNTAESGKLSAYPDKASFEKAASTFKSFFHEVFGFMTPASGNDGGESMDAVMKMVLDLRASAKSNKDYATADKIRDDLKSAGINILDTPQGSKWEKSN